MLAAIAHPALLIVLASLLVVGLVILFGWTADWKWGEMAVALLIGTGLVAVIMGVIFLFAWSICGTLSGPCR